MGMKSLVWITVFPLKKPQRNWLKPGQLAVECDGDAWHGIEQFEEDFRRQKDLERCGWTFWRIRSSEYYYNKNNSLDGLWEKLSSLGIHPDIPINNENQAAKLAA